MKPWGRLARLNNPDRYGGRREGESAEDHLRRAVSLGGQFADEVAAEVLLLLQRVDRLERQLGAR